MNITLYNFSKRINSLKVPSEGTTVSMVLKDTTSIYTPTFLLATNPLSYTYAKWDSRYYYITDIKHVKKDIYEVDCNIDTLATWRSQILSTSAFVNYSSSFYDIGLVDGRLSSKSSAIVNTSTTAFPVTGNVERYVISYIGINSVPLVAVTKSGLASLQSAMSTNAFAELFNDPSNAVSKMLTSTGSCITSCTLVPYCPIGQAHSIVFAGGYNTGVSGFEPDRSWHESVSVSIPWNFAGSDFRNRSQFTTVLLYLVGYGWIQLNADHLVGQSSITIDIEMDGAVGDVTYIIGNYAKASTNFGVPMQVSTTTNGNAIQAINGGISAGINAQSGNTIGAVQGTFNAILSGTQTNVGSVGSTGGMSSMLAYPYFKCVCISHDTSDSPSDMASVQGRPLQAVTNLGNLSGYVECVNASVQCNAPDKLKTEMNNYLNGGVYIE